MPRLPSVGTAFVLAATLTLTADASAQTQATVPPNFQETVVFSDLTEPTTARFSPDGRVFVAEKSGLIRVYDSLSDPTPATFANLSATVHNFWDRGLLGMTLAPDFPADPSVYVLYTYDAAIGGTAPRWGTGQLSDGCPTPPGATTDGCVVSGRLSRLTANGNQMSGPEHVLINDWCQQFPSHSMGSLNFGADGALYVSAGDGASFNFADYGQRGNPCGDPPGTSAPTPPTAEGGALRAQDIRTTLDPVGLNGSILRVDPATGAGMPDNPQGLSTDPNARRVVAHGLRNPFRFTFRPGTNEVWAGDVGWNDWDEIDRIPNPTDGTIDNFGWPCYEGTGRNDSYDGANLNLCETLYSQGPGAVSQPHFSYSGNDVVPGDNCTDGGSSISGLAFYPGGNYPAEYLDGLFFTDYARECIWFMPRGANGLPDAAQRKLFARGTEGPVDLMTGPNGDLFYVDFDFGRLMRISYSGSNQAPTAVATASPQSGAAPLTVQFDGTGSSDPEGGAVAYEWDLDGDGAYDDSATARPTFTYTQSRAWSVGLRVRDAQGATGTDVVVVTVGSNAPPVPTIASPTASTHWKVGDTLAFSGSATDAEDGPLPASALSWKLQLRHCPTGCHTHPVQDFPGVASGSFVAPDHEYPSHLELELTATDSDGVATTTMLRLDPQTVDLTFQASQPGLRLVTGGSSRAAPYTVPVIVGSSNSIAAPTPQTLGGSRYTFASWSDGGAAAHNIVAGASPATYTATFQETALGPVAAYAFDEGGGTSAGDASGSGNGGTVAGATWTASGRHGGALSFDGIDDRVVVPDADSLDLGTGMTLEAWVRPATLGSAWRTVLFKAQADNHVWALYGSDGTRPRAEAFIGSDVFQAAGTGALAANQWAHLTATYDGTLLRLYVNGTLATSTTVEGSLLTSTGDLWIGGNPVWAEWFSGLIDEIRVYDRALTGEQIAADMAVPVGAPDTEAPAAPPNLAATGGRGSVALTWSAATDDVGVHHYNVHRSTTPGFTPTAGNRIAQPTGTSYTDSGLAAGQYHYAVTAADDAGNVGPASEASATATADTTPPSVAITAPAAGATVANAVTLSATASDDDGVVGVQFKVDGANAGAEDTSAPYSVQWESRSVANGDHDVTAVARDASGNQRTAEARRIVVDNPTAPPPTGLVAAYGFDEGSGGGTGDASGAGNAGTVAGATWSTAGRFGGALSFDGVNDRVTAPDANSLDLTSGMTLEAWVRPSAANNWRTAIAKEHGTTVAYSLYSNRNTNVPHAEIYSGGRLRGVNGTGALPLNAWSHLAATFDGAQVRIFVNGAQVGAINRAGTIEVAAGPLTIGGNGPFGEWFAGLMDEVRVYNRALSAAEIQADMTTPIGAPDSAAPSAPGTLAATGGRGSVALSWGAATDNVGVHHYDVHRSTTAGFTPTAANRIAQPTGTSYLDQGLAAGTYHYVVRAADAAGNLGAASNQASGTATADTTLPDVAVTAPLAGATVSGTVALTASATDDDAVAGVQFKVDGANVGAEDTAAPYTIQWDSRTVANGARDIAAVARDRAGNARTSAAVRVTVNNQAAPPPTGLVAAYGFEAGSGTQVADTSGTGNHGATRSGAAWATGGHTGGALSFDGTDDAVVVPDANSLDLTAGMTLEAWVRPTANGGRWRTAIAKASTGSVSYVLYGNRNTNITTTEVFVGNRLRTANGTALPLNAWTHIAATYDGTTLRMYAGGVQVGQTGIAGAITPSTGELWLGGNPVWSEWFAGLMDDVRIYNRALTPTEIQADMARPVT